MALFSIFFDFPDISDSGSGSVSLKDNEIGLRLTVYGVRKEQIPPYTFSHTPFTDCKC
jgi:hypothetical protein